MLTRSIFYFMHISANYEYTSQWQHYKRHPYLSPLFANIFPRCALWLRQCDYLSLRCHSPLSILANLKRRPIHIIFLSHICSNRLVEETTTQALRGPPTRSLLLPKCVAFLFCLFRTSKICRRVIKFC